MITQLVLSRVRSFFNVDILHCREYDLGIKVRKVIHIKQIIKSIKKEDVNGKDCFF